MPLYLIERNFAEQLDLSPEAAAGITRVNDDVGVRWLYSSSAPTRRRPTAWMRPPAQS